MSLLEIDRRRISVVVFRIQQMACLETVGFPAEIIDFYGIGFQVERNKGFTSASC